MRRSMIALVAAGAVMGLPVPSAPAAGPGPCYSPPSSYCKSPQGIPHCDYQYVLHVPGQVVPLPQREPGQGACTQP